MTKTPASIKKLLNIRQVLRREHQFKQADQIRRQLIETGYEVKDYRSKTTVSPRQPDQPAKQSYIALFGSGETSSVSASIHDHLFRWIGKPKIRIALVSTPAGFQPNVKKVYAEVADFFIKRLQNYQPKVDIIFANNSALANSKKIIQPLELADYIFTGPGSPTYAVKHLKNSLLLNKIKARLSQGASLGLASAATLAFSRLTLPVYEIFKAGEPLSWRQGLNFYSRLFKPITVIPHFNNNEGGEKTDTSRCFMGRDRFKKLLTLLPAREKIYGLDENTAAVINLKTQRLQTLGKGKFRLLRH